MKFLRGCFLGCFGLIAFIVVAVMLLGGLIVVSDFEEWVEDFDPEIVLNEDIISPDDIYATENVTSVSCAEPIKPATHKKKWKTDRATRLAMEFKVSGEKKCRSRKNREKISEYQEYTTDGEYWRKIYEPMIKFDDPQLKPIYEHFKILKEEKKLGYAEFAEAIVSFIQHIPYVLVLDITAEEAIKKQNKFYKEYIVRDKRPYVENVKHGLHSPVEFLHTQQGDCDTRTVLAYTILTHFGYDVAIVNNPTHSMLGINLPAQGTYVKHQGKKYYIWETTAKGWQLGVVSPEHQKGLHICVPSRNNN
ncbi:MAG: hypothetical protein JJT94_06165 [Bernardetiaceae bacterium]|nr:hypothetical protein [Bernardetiaceae bacterium]